MAADGRMPKQVYPTPSTLARLLGIALAIAPAARANDVTDSFGDDRRPAVTLAVPVMPTIVDGSGRLLPAMRQWLSYVADKSFIHLTVQAANFDRRTADMARFPDHCVLGYARLTSREGNARWLAPVRRDRMVFIARPDDPFKGGLEAFLKIANGDIAAPSGIYRERLNERGVDFVAIDDQRSLARMVQTGRVRFGMVIAGTLNAPEVQAMGLRIVAELPPQEFWFACSPSLPDSIAVPLTAVLLSEASEALRRVAMSEPAPNATPPTQ